MIELAVFCIIFTSIYLAILWVLFRLLGMWVPIAIVFIGTVGGALEMLGVFC